MKKHYIFKFTLLLIPISAFILMSSSGGRTDARSGSPGDGGASCAACHTGGSSGVSASITTNIPNDGYALNTDYTITVNKSSSGAGGFQLVAENTANSKVGTFTAGSGSRVSGSRITHSSSGNSSWSFTWKSPATDQGEVKFYSSVVIADGNGSNGAGDKVVNTSTVGATVLGISEAKRLDFELFPNPASENINIQLPSGETKATVQFYDYLGKLALTQKITAIHNRINVNSLSTGIYIMKVATDSKIGSQKFIKN
ncbi:choice-of-anchor V domain-containing protein [Polaribacter sp. R77954]|uniref:choice-of-anchor V domain-containing protein n=1 Tax=Polaribacter sp. R77954 TaxID=3093870 RepID=UPI0037C5FB8A